MPRRLPIHRVAWPPSFPKTCTLCQQEKPRSEFPSGQKYSDGYTSQCKACVAARRKLWHKANLEKILARQNKWYEKNFGSRRGQWLDRMYGIGLEGYNALAKSQGGLCAICRKPESVIHKSGTPMELAVDHCHVTGGIRGLLCAKCNKAIGLLEDDPALLRAAAEYIEAHGEEPGNTQYPDADNRAYGISQRHGRSLHLPML